MPRFNRFLVFAVGTIGSLCAACGGTSTQAFDSPDAGGDGGAVDPCGDCARSPEVPNGMPTPQPDSGATIAIPDAGSGYPAPHHPLPVIKNFGGSVLSDIKIVTVTFEGDARRDEKRNFDDKIVTSPWWSAVTRDYGINAGTSGGHVELPDDVSGTTLDDDILFINSATLGRAYFSNVGQTRRQGLDAGLQARTGRLLAYAEYAFTDATYRSGFAEGGGNNPAQDANGQLQVRRGNRLPGIPQSQLKLGAQYDVTDAWVVGATGLAASGAYLFGDEANLTPRLPAYFTLNLNTSYQVTPHVQLFALGQNVTDHRYYTYGTFSPTAAVHLAQAPNATNPRSYSLAAPIGGFGGVRVTF